MANYYIIINSLSFYRIVDDKKTMNRRYRDDEFNAFVWKYIRFS